MHEIELFDYDPDAPETFLGAGAPGDEEVVTFLNLVAYVGMCKRDISFIVRFHNSDYNTDPAGPDQQITISADGQLLEGSDLLKYTNPRLSVEAEWSVAR